MPVYGGMPPAAATVTVEVPPLQPIGVAVAVTDTAAGCVTSTDTCAVQLFASVTVKVCVPAPRWKAPVPVYGGVPPAALTVTDELPPLHAITVDVAEAVSCAGSVIVMDVVAEQLAASVTVKFHVPAARWKLPVPVYGGVPPVAATVTVEVPPLQSMRVALAVATTDAGAVIVIVAVPVQLFASVTVKVCVPALRGITPVPE